MDFKLLADSDMARVKDCTGASFTFEWLKFYFLAVDLVCDVVEQIFCSVVT